MKRVLNKPTRPLTNWAGQGRKKPYFVHLEPKHFYQFQNVPKPRIQKQLKLKKEGCGLALLFLLHPYLKHMPNKEESSL